MAELVAPNWRRRLWWLALAAWIVASVLTATRHQELLSSPFMNVCASDRAEFYEECISGSAKSSGRIHEPTPDHTPMFREFQTRGYRESAAELATYEVGWAVVVWGTFYAGVWLIAGWRRGR